ncbi:hypothetical protein NW762_013269 [Fusarium torreyae]|uniref:Protein kinase domain-containing protein n=1 Tax=Fusarium torreyae TaxID=1237075 RepID=A0A9W8VAK1_9HYPO|nr:hypothetical protein NW762_013269 [Fusarium torreyae]
MPTLKPLPDCEGPKLECFSDDIMAHDFKLLTFLGKGCHSVVFKAEIDGKIYVIKFFFAHSSKNPEYQMAPIDEGYDAIEGESSVPLVASDTMPQSAIDSLFMHATSFYNECRAYGRLKELSREHLAIKAHGYLRVHLNDQIREQFTAAMQKDTPGCPDVTLDVMMHEDLDVPVMAIVKDWVPDHRLYWYDPEYSPENSRKVEQRQINHLPRMLRNLRQLHKCGIVVRDLKEVQYYEGQLGDLSHAWTIPHIFGPESGLRPRWNFASMAAWDLKCFQQMLDDYDDIAREAEPPLKTHNLVAWRNDQAYGRLRPRPEMHGPFLPMLAYDDPRVWDLKDFPPYDPAEFNWKAAQKKTKKASTGGVTKKRKTGRMFQTRSKKAKKNGELEL